MEESTNNAPIQEEETRLTNAGPIGIGVSVLVPVIGIIIYLCQRKAVKNPEVYLYGAGIGFIIAFISILMVM